MFAFLVLASFVSCIVLPIQQPLGDEFDIIAEAGPLEKLAIIGSGITGASLAFQVQQLTRLSPKYNITIFEAEANVGGRIKSARWPRHPQVVVEAGSLNFFAEDQCIKEAAEDLGLELGPPERDDGRTTGVWSGYDLSPSSRCDARIPSLIELVRYGPSPWIYRRGVQRLTDLFRSFASSFMFFDVTQELEDNELERTVLQRASEYFEGVGVSYEYQTRFAEPCTTQRFLQDGSDVHDLAALMSGQKTRLKAIKGGNAKLVERLIALSGAEVHSNTRVLDVDAGIERDYGLRYADLTSVEGDGVAYEEFDKVAIAAPFAIARLRFGDIFQVEAKNQLRYADAVVTHFVSEAGLTPTYFGLPYDATLPDEILMTQYGSSTLRLYSITRETACWVDSGLKECQNLYRVLSGFPLNDAVIDEMLGGKAPTWVHREPLPGSVPIHLPAPDIEARIELSPGLFYGGGADGIMSSVEVGCRMGRNIARIVSYS